MKREYAWKKYDETAKAALNAFCEDYKEYLSENKTERECVTAGIEMAKKAGYRDLEEIIASGEGVKAGDKIYAVNMKKGLMTVIVGDRPMAEGFNILGAHVDSPRLDVKQNPLYEEAGFAYLDTHYYGGIRKYQWLALPLAIHGVVAKKDGSVIELNIGEKEDDPVVGITDLLPHLAQEQTGKTISKAFEGEKLDVMIGSIPLADTEKDAVAAYMLQYLKETYQIEEEDFLSAELEIVPAGKARDFGLDRSMIMSYGQDDRICGYTSLRAMLDIEKTERTSICLLVDKEEIGSVGATGMHSHFFEDAVAELMELHGESGSILVRRALRNSKMLSSDVGAGYDPLYPEVMEKKNSCFLGKGLCIMKFTGSRGKSGSNDANAEYIAEVRKIFDDAEITFQTAELGRVDVGGGGTIAYITANYGMNVIDSGVAVLSMHAPWEVTSKADVYEAYKGYQAFIQSM